MDAIVYDKVGKEAEKVREALYGIYPQETITDAAIASFDDGADGIPVKALTVGIEPVQDLHGYDHPWPAGGGKNLFPPLMFDDSDSLTYGGITMTPIANGFHLQGQTTATGGRTNLVSKAFVLPAGTYTLSVKDGYSDIAPVVESSASPFPAVISGSGTFTLEAETSLLLGFQISATGSTVNKDYFVQIELGSTATEWTPYSNECPISGWTGAEISNAAVNIWDEDWANGYYDTSGNFVSSGNYVCSKNKIMVEPDTLYYLHFPVAMTIRAYDSNQQFIGTVQGTWRNETFKPAGYFSGVRYITFNSAASGALTTYNHDISINYPATDTAYHPYTGNQISVNWETEAGTVYGATMTLNPDRTGTLVTDRAMVDLGTLGYSKSSLVQNGFVSISGMPSDFPLAHGSTDIPNWICSNYGNIVSNNAIELASVDYALAWRISAQNKGIIVKDSNYTEYYTNNDMASFKSAMSGVQLVYEPTTPTTIPLTAEQVSGILTTLYGTNNVWASTGNIEKLTYRADLGKYIDSHITTAVANALNA